MRRRSSSPALVGGAARFFAISAVVLDDADEADTQTAVAIFCLGAAGSVEQGLVQRGGR